MRRLRADHPDLPISVSVTTRFPRPGEVDGGNYRFVTDEVFDQMVAAGEFLEWAIVHGRAKYGTPRAPVERVLAEGRSILVEVDLQGARQIRESGMDAQFVFLKPPSWDELVRRLVVRGTESEAEQERRLTTAKEELAAESEFDVTLVNHDVEQVCKELVALMQAGTPRDLGDTPANPSTTSPEA